MPSTSTYYEILGVPKEATLVQIKRRYKQLARKYHPDVARDKEMAHRLFIEFTEAYEVLSDPARRRAYDANLNIHQAREAERFVHDNEHSNPQDETVEKLLQDAQLAYIQRRFTEATEFIRRAIAMDPSSGSAYAILGDVMRVKGKLGEAVKAYSYALQYNPTDKETEKKLLDIVSKHVAKASKVVAETEASPKAHVVVNIVVVGVALFLLFLIRLHPGAPIASLKTYAPPASLWSANMAGFIAASSLLIGLALAINGLVANPDEEILFEGGNNWAVVPTGIGLLFGSGFFFLGAAAFYLLVGFIQGSVSRSVVTVFACVTAVVLIAAIMYNRDPAIKQVLLFGGNVSFLPMLIGWYIGAAFRPLNE